MLNEDSSVIVTGRVKYILQRLEQAGYSVKRRAAEAVGDHAGASKKARIDDS